MIQHQPRLFIVHLQTSLSIRNYYLTVFILQKEKCVKVCYFCRQLFQMQTSLNVLERVLKPVFTKKTKNSLISCFVLTFFCLYFYTHLFLLIYFIIIIFLLFILFYLFRFVYIFFLYIFIFFDWCIFIKLFFSSAF